ncbi:MAG TPA: hypothetical protein VF772_00190, partial [Terriglobales bacterium]
PSEQVAETLLCTKQDNRDSIAKAPQPELGYGKYYVTAFRMKVRDGEAAALSTYSGLRKDVPGRSFRGS